MARRYYRGYHNFVPKYDNNESEAYNNGAFFASGLQWGLIFAGPAGWIILFIIWSCTRKDDSGEYQYYNNKFYTEEMAKQLEYERNLEDSIQVAREINKRLSSKNLSSQDAVLSKYMR